MDPAAKSCRGRFRRLFSFLQHHIITVVLENCKFSLQVCYPVILLVLLQKTLQEAIALCSCKAMHDPYGLQHFYLARMEEGRRLSKQKIPQPEAMADMMADVLVSCWVFNPYWHLGLSRAQQ